MKIEIPNISNLATKTLVNKVENRIPDISNLATKTALTTVENKIPNVNSLVKKTNYNTKISSLDGKIDKINSDAKNELKNLIKIVIEIFF